MDKEPISRADKNDIIRLYHQGYAYARIRKILALRVSLYRIINIVNHANRKRKL